MAQIACPSDQEKGAAVDRLNMLFPEWAGELPGAENEGFVTSRRIDLNGRPMFVVWFAQSPNRTTKFLAAQALSDRPDFSTLVRGITAIAQGNGSDTMLFETKRGAMVRQARRHGFKVKSLVLEKRLC